MLDMMKMGRINKITDSHSEYISDYMIVMNIVSSADAKRNLNPDDYRGFVNLVNRIAEDKKEKISNKQDYLDRCFIIYDKISRVAPVELVCGNAIQEVSLYKMMKPLFDNAVQTCVNSYGALIEELFGGYRFTNPEAFYGTAEALFMAAWHGRIQLERELGISYITDYFVNRANVKVQRAIEKPQLNEEARLDYIRKFSLVAKTYMGQSETSEEYIRQLILAFLNQNGMGNNLDAGNRLMQWFFRATPNDYLNNRVPGTKKEQSKTNTSAMSQSKPTHEEKLKASYYAFTKYMDEERAGICETVFPGGINQANRVLISIANMMQVNLDDLSKREYDGLLISYFVTFAGATTGIENDEELIDNLLTNWGEFYEDEELCRQLIALTRAVNAKPDFCLLTEDDYETIEFWMDIVNYKDEVRNRDNTDNLESALAQSPHAGKSEEKPLFFTGIHPAESFLQNLVSSTGETLRWNRLGSYYPESLQKPVDCYAAYLTNGTEYGCLYCCPYGKNNYTGTPAGYLTKQEFSAQNSRNQVAQAAQQQTTGGINFCYKCGTKLRSDSNFCHACGTKVR